MKMRTSAAFGVLAIVALPLIACDRRDRAPQTTTPPATTPTPTPTPSSPKRLLVVTHTAGFRHSSIPIAEATLAEIGISSRLYDTEFCRTAADVQQLLTASALARFDAVFFANTTGNLEIPDMAAFLTWISDGGGFLGAHSASDTYHDSAEFLAMLGGEFQNHGSIVETDVRVDDPSHPSVAHYGSRFRITDELYRFTRFDRGNVQMLLSLDRNPADGLGTPGQPVELPMAWHRTHGGGRVFYTAFGHREEVWQDAAFRQHLREAIRWVIKL